MIFSTSLSVADVAKALEVDNPGYHSTKQRVVDKWIDKMIGENACDADREKWEDYAGLILENYIPLILWKTEKKKLDYRPVTADNQWTEKTYPVHVESQELKRILADARDK